MVFLSCQIQNGVQFNGLHIENVQGGKIFSTAHHTSESIPAKFSITNITTSGVNTKYGSLISLKDKVELEIRDSNILAVSSFQRGAIVSIEGTGSTVAIHN
mmetsp:Transcript_2043/g.1931  ORF Transcript_2043/g.1931 Transcript_2043/m.1931 type:complete len:101 (+) Transcript_2043:79-381(+)